MITLKKIILILSLAFTCGAIHSYFSPIELYKLDPLAVTARQFLEVKAKSKIIVLDVRKETVFTKAHYPEAIHFEISEWEKSFDVLMAQFTGDEIIYVYCDTGCGSSKSVVQRLRESGLDNSFFIHNGYSALLEEKEQW